MNSFIRLLKYIKPYKGLALTNLIFNILAIIFSVVSLTMVIPFLRLLFGTQELINTPPQFSWNVNVFIDYFHYYLSQIIVTYGKSEALLFICILVTALFLLKNLFRYTALHALVPIRVGVVRDIRYQVYNKLLHLPLLYFSEKQKGNLIARMTTDVQEVEWSVMSSIEVIFKDPFNILFFLIAMLIMSPELTLFVIILLPITGLIIGKIGNSLKKYSIIGQQKMGEIISVIDETLGGLRIIKAFTAEQVELEKFKQENDKHGHFLTKIYRKRELSSPLTEFLGALVLVVVMWFGGKLVLTNQGGLDAAVFIAFIAIFSQIIPPAKSISTAFYNIQKGLASLYRIEEILLTENKIKEADNPISVRNFNDEIRYQKVSFSYNTNKNGTQDFVLKNINISIKKGETVALVGPSGSGKSTLIDLIPRFFDPIDGEIFIDNIPIKSARINDLRNLMGIVTQEPILFNDTIYNNIAFGKRNATEEEVINAAKIANAHDFIQETENNYQTNIGDRGCKLSGGQRQRIAIARAILKNPPILILDEATSSLDTESEKLVQDALHNLMKNRTSIVIAHRLSTIQHADRIIVIENGEIIEEGIHSELINFKGTYKKLYELQSFYA